MESREKEGKDERVKILERAQRCKYGPSLAWKKQKSAFLGPKRKPGDMGKAKF